MVSGFSNLCCHLADSRKTDPSPVYRRLPVVAGKHHFVARLSDQPSGAFSFTGEKTVDLKPGRIMVIDFLGVHSGFVFKS